MIPTQLSFYRKLGYDFTERHAAMIEFRLYFQRRVIFEAGTFSLDKKAVIMADLIRVAYIHNQLNIGMSREHIAKELKISTKDVDAIISMTHTTIAKYNS